MSHCLLIIVGCFVSRCMYPASVLRMLSSPVLLIMCSHIWKLRRRKRSKDRYSCIVLNYTRYGGYSFFKNRRKENWQYALVAVTFMPLVFSSQWLHLLPVSVNLEVLISVVFIVFVQFNQFLPLPIVLQSSMFYVLDSLFLMKLTTDVVTLFSQKWQRVNNSPLICTTL